MPRNMIRKLVRAIFDTRLPTPSNFEKGFLLELQQSFQQLPVRDVTTLSRAENAWRGNMNRLRELVLSQDPREFLRWDVISQTMFVDDARYLSKELAYLKQRPDWGTRWKSAIRESSVGHPTPYVYYPRSSGNLIHHAYHLANFEEKTGIEVQNVGVVFEFGGGYGSMCRLFHNLGFQDKYIIFDLPHFSLLQKYFLQVVGLTVHRSVKDFVAAHDGVLCVSDSGMLVSALAHVDYTNSMFLGTWSVSESPLDVRSKIMPLLAGFNSFLFAYQDTFEEIDNIIYFDNWRENVRSVVWHSWPIAHAPGNNYLVGSVVKMMDL